MADFPHLFSNGLLFSAGFDLGVNKQLMIEVSGLPLGPPRLPVRPCPPPHAQKIAHKYHTIFPIIPELP